MEAAEFFEAHHAEGNISKELQVLDEAIQVKWESVSVHPNHSPGPVEPEETVCRPHVNPTHYEPGKQQLKPTAFQDAASFGLSVDRLKYASVETILAKADQRTKAANRPGLGPDRSVFGYSTFSVSELREVRVRVEGSKGPDRRGIGVYDTALPAEPEHADVCIIAPKSHGGRSARFDLFRQGNANHKLIRMQGADSSTQLE